MSRTILRVQRLLASLALALLLLAAVDLDLDSRGGLPALNDQGALALPLDGEAELEEAMPELQLLRTSETPESPLSPSSPLP